MKKDSLVTLNDPWCEFQILRAAVNGVKLPVFGQIYTIRDVEFFEVEAIRLEEVTNGKSPHDGIEWTYEACLFMVVQMHMKVNLSQLLSK